MTGPLLEIHRVPDDGRVVLVVTGEVDMATAGALRDALRGAASEAEQVWLDLTAVEFMDSSGLNVLLAGQEAMGYRGLTIVCPGHGPVRRALNVSGLGPLLNVVDADGAT